MVSKKSASESVSQRKLNLVNPAARTVEMPRLTASQSKLLTKMLGMNRDYDGSVVVGGIRRR